MAFFRHPLFIYFMQLSFICYFSLERKVTKSSRLNRLGYSGQRLRCRLRNSLTLRQRRLRTLRLCPSLDAHPLRPFQESSAFSRDGRHRLLYKHSYQYLHPPKPPPPLFCRLLKQAASAIPKEPSGSTSGLSW